MDRTVALPGFDMTYIREGSGEPVLLVHGSAVDGRVWSEHRQALANSFDVIVPTQRYFGPMPWTDGGDRFGITQHGADLLAFIDRLGIGGIDAVGWSYGGAVALAAAVANPTAFRRIILYEPAFATHLENPKTQAAAAADRSRMMFASQELIKKERYELAVEAFIDGVNDKQGTFCNLPAIIQDSMKSSARTLPLLYNAPPPNIGAADLRRLDCTVVIGVGTQSREFFKLASIHAANTIRSAALEWVDGGHHMWPVEELENCIQFISRSLTHDNG